MITSAIYLSKKEDVIEIPNPPNQLVLVFEVHKYLKNFSRISLVMGLMLGVMRDFV